MAYIANLERPRLRMGADRLLGAQQPFTYFSLESIQGLRGNRRRILYSQPLLGDRASWTWKTTLTVNKFLRLLLHLDFVQEQDHCSWRTEDSDDGWEQTQKPLETILGNSSVTAVRIETDRFSGGISSPVPMREFTEERTIHFNAPQDSMPVMRLVGLSASREDNKALQGRWYTMSRILSGENTRTIRNGSSQAIVHLSKLYSYAHSPVVQLQWSTTHGTKKAFLSAMDESGLFDLATPVHGSSECDPKTLQEVVDRENRRGTDHSPHSLWVSTDLFDFFWEGVEGTIGSTHLDPPGIAFTVNPDSFGFLRKVFELLGKTEDIQFMQGQWQELDAWINNGDDLF